MEIGVDGMTRSVHEILSVATFDDHSPGDIVYLATSHLFASREAPRRAKNRSSVRAISLMVQFSSSLAEVGSGARRGRSMLPANMELRR